ncbi:MAG: hypothetical protein WC474_06010 [Hydrogenophilaceae bacterium]
MSHCHDTDIRCRVRHAEALRQRLLRRWVAHGLGRLAAALAGWRGETELRALDERELHDLGLDRGGIAYAVRHGRERPGSAGNR